jgi:glycosyltransferase involved in cell wall biosynthesis
MDISFVLPGIPLKPVGGVKIVFEYSNRLSKRGHNITIYFDCKKTFNQYKMPDFIRRFLVKKIIKYIPNWFDLNNDIQKKCIFGIKDETINKSDVVIATAVTTADGVYNLHKTKGEKAYFIQDFENWDHSKEYVFQTYNYNMKNIVIAKWIKDIVDKKSDHPSIVIPNGIDFNVFGIDIPIKKRNRYSISMLYHNKSHKGSKYGIEVLKRLKEKHKDLTVKMFGVPSRPKKLPQWINYTQNANEEQLRYIYNNSSIFLSTSVEEGFGLTGAESMACGCALVSTDYKGVNEYAINGRNALISPVKDINSLVKNVEKLFHDDQLRQRIAKKGNQDIQKLSWDKSVNKFEKTLNNLIKS